MVVAAVPLATLVAEARAAATVCANLQKRKHPSEKNCVLWRALQQRNASELQMLAQRKERKREISTMKLQPWVRSTIERHTGHCCQFSFFASFSSSAARTCNSHG